MAADETRKILVIEDEANVASFIRQGLEEEFYAVDVSPSGKNGLSLLEKNAYSALILDVILPDTTGFAVCKKLRSEYRSEIPVIMLTALNSTEDIVTGLESGADDYLAKPFKFRELLARVNALIRRSRKEAAARILQCRDLTVNLDSMEVTRAGKATTLTATEFRLLEYFLRNRNRVLSRDTIIRNVWDSAYELSNNVVDVYVNYLRNKIDKGQGQKLIHTVVGMGYMLKEE